MFTKDEGKCLIILLDICGIEATPLGGWEAEKGRNVQ